MVAPPEGMYVFTVVPANFEDIIEVSKNTEVPYQLADLKATMAEASSRNCVAMIAFMGPDFWEGDRE